MRRLQEYLTRFGYMQPPSGAAFAAAKTTMTAESAGDLLGNFGNATLAALRRFQEVHRLPVTGRTDKRTLALMARPRCGVPDGALAVKSSALAAAKDRWDKGAMTYAFVQFTADLPRATVRAAIRQAFALWSQAAMFSFSEVQGSADMIVAFAAGNHGDGAQNAFDGASGVLAHAFYPPPRGGDFAGDIHFDDAEPWTVALPPTGIDLVTVAAHEIGHALGLEHSADANALMYAYYGGEHRRLGADDVTRIQSLYGPPSHQFGWRWCAKCQGLWYGGHASSLCAAGGGHTKANSGLYSLAHNAGDAPGQSNWRWCSRCQGLWWAGNPGNPGRCVGTGSGHSKAGSGNYTLPHNDAKARGQKNWRWCSKCSGLWYGGHPAGPCPGGGSHNMTGSGNYTLKLL